MHGVSLSEILIVFAIATIILSGTLPDPQQTLIRANVGESLKIATSAQQALLTTCDSNNAAVVKTNLDAGFFYLPTGTEEDHISRILLGANCSSDEMVIILWTSSTGAETDPVIELVANTPADLTDGNTEIEYTWSCHLIKGDLQHVPAGCQQANRKG